jgi:hypothetical protein
MSDMLEDGVGPLERLGDADGQVEFASAAST